MTSGLQNTHNLEQNEHTSLNTRRLHGSTVEAWLICHVRLFSVSVRKPNLAAEHLQTCAWKTELFPFQQDTFKRN